MKLFTIGHGNHGLDRLRGLLETNGVRTVVDVRSMPYSRYSPQFNKSDLDAGLAACDIRYLFAGKYLGGRPTDPSCYKSGVLPAEGTAYLREVDYAEVMKRDWFLRGIDRLLELADLGITSILCSEEDPARCHRHHLITKYILALDPGAEVRHIRGDGTIYPATTILKTVDKPVVLQPTLF